MDVDDHVHIAISPLQDVVDAFHKQLEQAIYASLAIFVHFAYSVHATLLGITLECYRVFKTVHHSASGTVGALWRSRASFITQCMLVIGTEDCT